MPTAARPSQEERSAELQQRERDMAAQRRALEDRLKRVPDQQQLAELDQALQAVRQNFGWVPDLQLVFGLNDMDALLEKKSKLR